MAWKVELDRVAVRDLDKPDRQTASLHLSPRGEVKCVRGPSGRGASRLARAGVLEQYIEHGKQAQRNHGGHTACFGRRVVRNAGQRVLAFLHGRVAMLDDPRSIGEALTGFKGSRLGEFWKYAAVRRVGDYRIIARIEQDALRVLLVRVGSRDKVFH